MENTALPETLKAQEKENRKRARASRRQSRRLDARKRRKEPFTITVILLITVFLLLFVIYPLAIVLLKSIKRSNKIGPGLYEDGFSWDAFKYLVTDGYWHPLLNSLGIGFIVATFATLLGLLFAYVEVYVKFKSRFVPGLFKVVSLLPTISPPFLVAIARRLLFGNNGLITNGLFGLQRSGLTGWVGVCTVEIITFFPTAYLRLRALLKNIDPSLEEASRDRGAGRWKVFRTVTLPLRLPGLGNAFLVSRIESLADFANPFIIGGNVDTMSTKIYNTYRGGNGRQAPYRAAARAVVLLLISMFFYIVQKYCIERKSYATLSGKATRARIRIEDRSVVRPLGILCGTVSMFVIGLYFRVFLCTFWRNRDIKNLVWTTANWTEIGGKRFSGSSSSLWTTIWTSAVAAVITSLLSMLIAFLRVKKRFPGKGAIEFTSRLARAVPGTVLGIGYALGFVLGLFESKFLRALYGTTARLVIIFIVRSLPIGVRSGVTALNQIDKSIEESASDRGAGSGRIFATVTVPLIKDSLFSSLVTSFVRSRTAISAVIVVSVPGTTLVTYERNELAGKGAYEQAAVYATVRIIIAGIAVGLRNLFIKFFGTSRVRKENKPSKRKGK